MRNKMEFEARVRELAAQKQEASLKRQRKIRNFTIVGGVAACAACCAIVFTRMNGINKISGSSNLKNESFSGADLHNEMYQEDGTEIIMNNGVLPEADGNKSEIENDAVSGGSPETGGIRVDAVSILREDNISDATATQVLLDGDNEGAVELIAWIEELEITEISEVEVSETEINYEIKLYMGQDTNLLLIKDNHINRDGTWYSFSAEAEAALNEILNKCF